MYLIFLLKKYLNNKTVKLIISQNLNYGFIGLVDNKKKADRKNRNKNRNRNKNKKQKQNRNNVGNEGKGCGSFEAYYHCTKDTE